MGLFDKLIKDMTGGNNGNSNRFCDTHILIYDDKNFQMSNIHMDLFNIM